MNENGFEKKLFFLILVLFLSYISVLQISCRQDKKERDAVAIQINRYRMTAAEYADLYRDVNSRPDTPQTRMDFLNALITRKILLQEAQRRGFDKEKEFLTTIEKFWEQSLLKLVVDRKINEIHEELRVGDPEILAAYEKWALENKDSSKTFDAMKQLLEWELVKEKEAAVLERWTDGLRAKAKIKINGKALGIEME